MKPKAHATLLLVGALLLGVVIGFLLAGALGQRRAERFERMRARGGFVEFMLDVIQPRDAAQRGEIVPILRETARKNQEIVAGSRRDLEAELDSLAVRLAPILDAEQMRRLETAGRLRDVFRRPGGPPPGPPGGGPGERRERRPEPPPGG